MATSPSPLQADWERSMCFTSGETYTIWVDLLSPTARSRNTAPSRVMEWPLAATIFSVTLTSSCLSMFSCLSWLLPMMHIMAPVSGIDVSFVALALAATFGALDLALLYVAWLMVASTTSEGCPAGRVRCHWSPQYSIWENVC